ncbi:MAG: YdcF family protein [Clostridiales bacterium]|nr:YdcF family protein [Clostridiales bacterium]
MKKIGKRHILSAVLLAVLIYTAVNSLAIWNYSKTDETQTADCAVVLGAAASDSGVSQVFKERLNHAVWLYREGYVKKLIITGGYGEGNEFSDAYMGSLYAEVQGIPPEDIFIEETSTITEENLENAKIIMENNELTSALIVSDPLHMKRAMLMAKDMGITAFSSPTKTSAYKGTRVKLLFLARETFFYVGYKFSSLIL